MKTGNPKIAEAGKGTQFSADNQPATRGRPKGTRDKFAAEFISDLADVWAELGKPALYAVAVFDTATFVKVGAALLPKEVTISTPESALTDEQVELLYQTFLGRLQKPEESEDKPTVN